MPNKRRCRHCKEYIDAEKAVIVPVGAFCSHDHAYAYAREKAPVARKLAARKAKTESKQQDLSHQVKLTQQAMNKMIRLLDDGLPCVSCGALKPHTAGHFKTVGAHPELRFYPINIIGQCSGCNMGLQKYNKGDNATTQAKFAAEIARRHGQEALDWLECAHPMANYTCDELADLRKILNAECRKLEKGEQPSRDWRSVRDWREML